MTEHHGIKHGLFGQAVGFGFNHQHGAFGTGHDEIEAGFLELGNRRVADETAVDVAHAAGADRALERDAGNGQCSRSTDHGRNIGIDFRINGQHVNDDLHFVEEAVREKRTNRTVDQTAREGFVFRRTAFTLEEATGELAGSISLFNVVDSKREEVLTGLGFLLGHNGSQNNRVAHLNDNGAGSLASNFARGKRHFVLPEHEALGDLVEHAHVSFLCSQVLCFPYGFWFARCLRARCGTNFRLVVCRTFRRLCRNARYRHPRNLCRSKAG